jgi:hypothetical protein
MPRCASVQRISSLSQIASCNVADQHGGSNLHTKQDYDLSAVFEALSDFSAPGPSPHNGCHSSLNYLVPLCSVKVTQNVYINAAPSSAVTQTVPKNCAGLPALLVTPLSRHSPGPTSQKFEVKQPPVFKLAQQHVARKWVAPQDAERSTLKVRSFLACDAQRNLRAMLARACCTWPL